MDYRTLGRTGVKISKVGLGCEWLGIKTSQEEADGIIDSALEAGINFLDTANVYGRGRSEEAIGTALKRNGQRDRIVLATKVFGPMADDDPNAGGCSRRHIIAQCEASLRRLQTDRIDLYQIHLPQDNIPLDETLRALDDLIHAGKVCYIGSSTFMAWQIVESLWIAKELGLNRFIAEQTPYNILERRSERELIPMAQTYGTAVIAWSPLGAGLLTGKYDRHSLPPADSRYADVENKPHMKARLNNAVFDVVDGLQPLATAKGCTLAQLALAWCTQQPGITSALIGPRTRTQLEDNLQSLNISILAEDQIIIDQLVAPESAVARFYEAVYGASFGPRLYRW